MGSLGWGTNDLEDAKRAVRDHSLGVAAPFGWAGSPNKRLGDIVETANELQRTAVEETRLGVPLLLNVDAVHGHAYVAGATVFLNGLGSAATWDVDAAVRKAADADVAVLALGEGWYLHEFGPADQAGVEAGDWPTRSELRLSEAQREPVRRVHDTGTPVGGVLVTGRLPISVPKSVGGVPQHFDALAHPHPLGSHEYPDSYDPLYEFGHGLSYITFATEDLDATVGGAGGGSDGDTVDVSVTVRNTGDRAGTETVQVFARQKTSSRVQPRARLVGFERVDIAPGDTEAVLLSVPAANFGFYNPREGHVVEDAGYQVWVDEETDSFELE